MRIIAQTPDGDGVLVCNGIGDDLESALEDARFKLESRSEWPVFLEDIKFEIVEE